MVSQFDLAPRLAALHASGMVVTGDYQDNHAKWLTAALDRCDCRVINVKGVRADDMPVMVHLSKLEELIAYGGPVAIAAVGKVNIDG